MNTACGIPLKMRSHPQPCRASPCLLEWSRMQRGLATGHGWEMRNDRYWVTSRRGRRAGFELWRPVANVRFREARLAHLFRYRLAHCPERLSVRRVLGRAVVLRERLFRVSLFREHIAPCLQRIGPVRPRLIGVCEFGSRRRASDRPFPRGILPRRHHCHGFGGGLVPAPSIAAGLLGLVHCHVGRLV